MPVDKINVTHRQTNAQTSVNHEFLGRGLLLSLEVLQVGSMVGAHHFTSGDVMDPNPVDGAINRKRWICHAPWLIKRIELAALLISTIISVII